MLATARISQKMAGAAGETAERARYIQLTRQGLNNSEICRQLGIGRKTGCTWRNGHSTRDPSGARRYHSPIVEVRESVVSARFLSEDERVHIAANAARSSDCAVLHCRVLAADGTADPRVVLAVTSLCGGHCQVVWCAAVFGRSRPTYLVVGQAARVCSVT
ncbi:helix-turn-helix domain-containing protein [Rhodococcus erythropolis]|uniref:helix-turn-helix domain-containing protein n=1 Tax=Rhodococcus erythropolis TaxID=1833 RepID=UPI0039819AF0